MKKVKLAFIAAAAVLCFACGGKTEADFSIVPVEGANGEYQYIDIPQKGKIVINPQFERAHLFRDGLALVKISGKEGKWGYIDKKGKYIIAPTYDYAQDFGDGVAWVQIENQPPMLIDKKGKMIFQMDSLIAAYPFNNGIAGITVYSRGQELTMFIDKKGKTVATTMPGEEVIPIINDGMYMFQDKASGKWGYKNKSGEIAINAQYDDVDFFLDGMAATLSGKKWGAIDKKGNILINPQYDSLRNDGNGLFLAKVGKKWGWVNKKNEITINPQFDDSWGFNGSKLAPVQMGSKWGYVDKEGQIIINPQFKGALSFNGDYAMVVSDDKKIGFIDKTGTFVVAPLYEVNISRNGVYGIYEYMLATWQNLYGLPMQYRTEESSDYQTANFGPYDRLKEKKEEERERAIAAASGSFTDSRDKKTYKTIKIGTQTWMAQNLNYNGEDGYLGLCYGDNPREQIRKQENCDKYGRLYDWSEAMGLDREYNWKRAGSDRNVQGICPSGWHLPSKDEWQTLLNFADGDYAAGGKLKARNGWSNNGTDEFGFSILPNGYGENNGRFHSIGDEAVLWTASEYNGNYAYRLTMNYGSSVNLDYRDKSRIDGVRCVKDSEVTAAEIAATAEAKETAKASVKSFTDSRDGTAYKTVTIGKQTWMAENLNYGVGGSKCYNNNRANCEKYGRLYDWETAIGACPNGWHLPKDYEWETLADYIGSDARRKLKSTSGWDEGGNGTDEYGFSALPSGTGKSDGTFVNFDKYSYWWSVGEGTDAYYRYITPENSNLNKIKSTKKGLFPIRCIQD